MVGSIGKPLNPTFSVLLVEWSTEDFENDGEVSVEGISWFAEAGNNAAEDIPKAELRVILKPLSTLAR